MVFFEFENFALHVDGDLLRQVAARHGFRHRRDVAHLARQIAGHEVHVVGEILPRAGDTLHLGLTAELAFGTHFASHAGHFRGERPQLIHHRVDGVLEFQDFAADVDRDLLRQVARRHGRRHFGDVANLAGQIAGHRVHAIREIAPRAFHAAHVGLSAKFSFGTHFAGHAGHFRRERPQLIHHRVDGVLEFENFALHVDRDLLRQVAAGHGRRHVGDVAHLARQVRRP